MLKGATPPLRHRQEKMDNSTSRMKRQMNEALREENQRLEVKIVELERHEAELIEANTTLGVSAIRALVQAVQALAAEVPNTASGVKALKRARCALLDHGVPLPTGLKKVPKPRRIRKKRKSLSRNPKSTA